MWKLQTKSTIPGSTITAEMLWERERIASRWKKSGRFAKNGTRTSTRASPTRVLQNKRKGRA
jgi:thymidylate synthase ThyX